MPELAIQTLPEAYDVINQMQLRGSLQQSWYAGVVPSDPSLVDAIRAVVQRAAGLRLVYLFGSQASGRARADSDLDLAVLYDEALAAAARERARRRLVAALTDALGSLGERADVVDLAAAGSAIGFRVIREGICVFAVDDALRVRFEARAARRYDDDAPVRRLFRRAAKRAGRAMGEANRGRQ